ncbi:hypothetical protein B0H16DRAFT_724721 [Mycena metata]|uniref:Uncharacterized protein n=1 Tax=Mycena metata TaxID=1033252 RepID=A0AAD7K9G8_9AGAR|nr:hypothetical protein B0H16DRAFT_724721 [Mycena metata]
MSCSSGGEDGWKWWWSTRTPTRRAWVCQWRALSHTPPDTRASAAAAAGTPTPCARRGRRWGTPPWRALRAAERATARASGNARTLCGTASQPRVVFPGSDKTALGRPSRARACPRPHRPRRYPPSHPHPSRVPPPPPPPPPPPYRSPRSPPPPPPPPYHSPRSSQLTQPSHSPHSQPPTPTPTPTAPAPRSTAAETHPSDARGTAHTPALVSHSRRHCPLPAVAAEIEFLVVLAGAGTLLLLLQIHHPASPSRRHDFPTTHHENQQ